MKIRLGKKITYDDEGKCTHNQPDLVILLIFMIIVTVIQMLAFSNFAEECGLIALSWNVGFKTSLLYGRENVHIFQ